MFDVCLEVIPFLLRMKVSGMFDRICGNQRREDCHEEDDNEERKTKFNHIDTSMRDVKRMGLPKDHGRESQGLLYNGNWLSGDCICNKHCP